MALAFHEPKKVSDLEIPERKHDVPAGEPSADWSWTPSGGVDGQ